MFQHHFGSHTGHSAPEPTTPTALMQQAGMEPDAHQQRFFDSTARHKLLLAHRQFGKSTCVGAEVWAEAHNTPGALILLISRTMRQSIELFRKVNQFRMAANLDMPLRRLTALSLETEHESRIISLPANPDTVVGYSAPSLIVIDEAARVPDELYYVLRPMLAMSKGRLTALSTPWGKRGWFHGEWMGEMADDSKALDLATVQALLADLGMTVTEDDLSDDIEAYEWDRHMITAPDALRLDKRFLANERRSVPDMIFRSEWLCEFTDSEGSVFLWDDIQAMLSDDVVPLWAPQTITTDILSADVDVLERA